MAAEAKRQQQSEKAVKGGGEGHRQTIRRRKTIGGDGGTHGTRQQDSAVREDKERAPENRWAHGEMIFKMAGRGAKFRLEVAIFV